jgi:hypothetical protein
VCRCVGVDGQVCRCADVVIGGVQMCRCVCVYVCVCVCACVCVCVCVRVCGLCAVRL